MPRTSGTQANPDPTPILNITDTRRQLDAIWDDDPKWDHNGVRIDMQDRMEVVAGYKFTRNYVAKFLPPYFYRVQYRGSRTTKCERTGDLLAGNPDRRITYRKDVFKDTIRSAFTWSTQKESQFINVFSIASHAQNWALKRRERLGEDVEIVTIDASKLMGWLIFKLEHLNRQFNLQLESTLKDGAKQHIYGAYLIHSHIPKKAIVKTTSTRDILGLPWDHKCRICPRTFEKKKKLFGHIYKEYTEAERLEDERKQLALKNASTEVFPRKRPRVSDGLTVKNDARRQRTERSQHLIMLQ